MNAAASYFKLMDINGRLAITSADALWNWITEDCPGLAGDDWQLAAGKNLFFRGQSDSAYGLSSSLYRDLRKARGDAAADPISEQEMALAEAEVIRHARGEELEGT